ncbi:MAG: hypothetical protein E6R03_09125 [Hyphomicrobiaceae bacterium]|nr:MAG: hypothetical protein E6R03_09125 [Hyphomicrobiaceae bacterium]
MIQVNTYEQLKAKLSSRIVIVEGPRCAGKDFLIGPLSKDLDYQVYECLKPRKQYLAGLGGSLSNLPADLDIQQAHLWSLDVFRQIPIRVIINRSMLTSQYFDGPHSDRLSMWVKMVQDLEAQLVLLLPSDQVHARRIAKAGRSSESTSIYAERLGIMRVASSLTKQLPNMIQFLETS